MNTQLSSYRRAFLREVAADIENEMRFVLDGVKRKAGVPFDLPLSERLDPRWVRSVQSLQQNLADLLAAVCEECRCKTPDKLENLLIKKATGTGASAPDSHPRTRSRRPATVTEVAA